LFAVGLGALLAAPLLTVDARESGAAACLGKPRNRFLIVLDVGHTPKEPGATSARGVPEYLFNLELGRRVEKELKSAGFAATRLLTIQRTGASGLRERPELANKWKADLFVSIHHDSVQPSYLQPWEFEGKQRRYSDEFSGYSLFVSKENASFNESVRLAAAIADQLRAAGRDFTRHHSFDVPGERREFIDEARGIYRYDGLAVLRMTKMPAVLVEAGVIVNRADEELVRQESYRDMVARAVTAAVQGFCEPPRSKKSSGA